MHLQHARASRPYVPAEVVNTNPSSAPSLDCRRSRACLARCPRNVWTALAGSARMRRDLRVFVSLPEQTDRQTWR